MADLIKMEAVKQIINKLLIIISAKTIISAKRVNN